MAKKSAIAKNEKRRRMVERYRARRAELKAIIRDETKTIEEREEAARRLRMLPRDASPVRVRNRCAVTGRPRAYYRKFGLSRIALRELGLQGLIPGLKKASW
ncbi:MAG: 30S ribosomal protein S14 [Acidobacteriota bacterium]|nr:MAG: 30S ribosomal protein S14 [Acidobacteriota bacterium]